MIIYIKEEKNNICRNNNIISKLFVFLKNRFNNIKQEQIDEDKWIITIKDINMKNTYIKLNKKIDKFIEDKNKSIRRKMKIVLSKNLKSKKKEFFKYDVIEGKEVQKYLVKDIIEYILKIQDKHIEQQDIYILTNTYNSIILSYINYFMKDVKTINIVTKEIDKYNKLQEDIYEKEGIILSVSNNKKKSIKKAELVINFDLDREEFTKYYINRNAIIINLSNEKMEYLKTFNGIIINSININISEQIKNYFKEKNILDEFEITELYESILSNNIKFEEFQKNIQRDKIEIQSLIGNNGIIDKKQILDKKY